MSLLVIFAVGVLVFGFFMKYLVNPALLHRRGAMRPSTMFHHQNGMGQNEPLPDGRNR